MADLRITEFTELLSVSAHDLVPVVDDSFGSPGTPTNFKIKVANFFKYAVTNVSIQVFTASGIYTPSSGMKACLVICQGGGGGAPAETGADAAVSGGGGGGCAIKLCSAALLGASQPVTVAIASSAAGNPSTFGGSPDILHATGGGVGASTGNTTTVGLSAKGGLGGIGSGGDINLRGGSGEPGTVFSTSNGRGGSGGDSFLGSGGRGGILTATVEQGEVGGQYGGGAGGGHCSDGTNLDAVAGAAGVVVILEFLEG